jgi:antitoxin YefM
MGDEARPRTPGLHASVARSRAGQALTCYILGICAIVMYMTMLPVADARSQLSKLIDQAASTHERFEITRNGHRTAVLLSADDYDAMQETIAVLSDTALLAAHREGEAAIASGDYLDADQLGHAMRAAGREPG